MYDHELHDVSCNLYDSIEALKREPITVIDNKDGTVEIKCEVSIEYNKDDWEQIAADPANGKYLSLLDLPKYEDGSSGTTSIGDCLLSSQDTINNNLPSQPLGIIKCTNGVGEWELEETHETFDTYEEAVKGLELLRADSC